MLVVPGRSQSCVSFSAFSAAKLSQLMSVSKKMFLSRILRSEPVTVLLWYSNNIE